MSWFRKAFSRSFSRPVPIHGSGSKLGNALRGRHLAPVSHQDHRFTLVVDLSGIDEPDSELDVPLPRHTSTTGRKIGLCACGERLNTCDLCSFPYLVGVVGEFCPMCDETIQGFADMWIRVFAPETDVA